MNGNRVHATVVNPLPTLTRIKQEMGFIGEIKRISSITSNNCKGNLFLPKWPWSVISSCYSSISQGFLLCDQGSFKYLTISNLFQGFSEYLPIRDLFKECQGPLTPGGSVVNHKWRLMEREWKFHHAFLPSIAKHLVIFTPLFPTGGAEESWLCCSFSGADISGALTWIHVSLMIRAWSIDGPWASFFSDGLYWSL